uniref:Acyltransferase 3 domain-containing protein n=1 Tax=Panagrolaimus sp. JU765 TaxID=591449 RepID=A0AC34RBQ3_9BILA
MTGVQLGICLFLGFSLSSTFARTTSLVDYPEDEVWKFVKTFPRKNASEKCGSSLDKVENYLNDKSTLEEQKEFYLNSFTTGDASQFISRDQDRWIFRAMECVKSAGETTYSASQYPMHYCYAFNNDDFGTAYGACIPSTCENDRASLLAFWQNLSSNGKDHQKLPYEDCTSSRHVTQWYQQIIPMADFGFDMFLFILVGCATMFLFILVGCATVLHWKCGDKLQNMLARIVLCWSLKKNLAKLVQMPKDLQSTITCMFGLRFLSLVWTLVGHSFIFVQAYLKNVNDYKDDLVDNFWNQWITNFTLSVDVFLTLSGCLTAFSWFKKWQKNTTETEPGWTSYGYWLRFYRHRLVRLWPAYIYAILTVTTRQRSLTFIIGGWTIAAVAGFWSFYGLYPSLMAWDWPVYHYVYGAWHRTVFSMALAWLIYACHTGIGGWVNTVLSHRFLLPLSTLSYSVYLFHMIPVVFTYLLAPFPMIFSTKWRMILHCFLQLCISYFFGIICTMVAELPALNIERILLTRKPQATLKPLSAQPECEVQLKPNEPTFDKTTAQPC